MFSKQAKRTFFTVINTNTTGIIQTFGKAGGIFKSYSIETKTKDNTLITNILPSPEIKGAMDKINQSQRLREASICNADADYIINKVKEAVKEVIADAKRKELQRIDKENVFVCRVWCTFILTMLSILYVIRSSETIKQKIKRFMN